MLYSGAILNHWRKYMPESALPETITTTIEVNKELFLKFKALCVLKELTISGEIENIIKKRVSEMEKEK